MNDTTKQAIEEMRVVHKITESGLDDINQMYILRWFISHWRDEAWVDEEIEYRKQYPLKELTERKML